MNSPAGALLRMEERRAAGDNPVVRAKEGEEELIPWAVLLGFRPLAWFRVVSRQKFSIACFFSKVVEAPVRYTKHRAINLSPSIPIYPKNPQRFLPRPGRAIHEGGPTGMVLIRRGCSQGGGRATGFREVFPFVASSLYRFPGTREMMDGRQAGLHKCTEGTQFYRKVFHSFFR